MWIVCCFPKKLFPTIHKVPTHQQQHIRRLIVFLYKKKNWPRLSKKILLQTKKCGPQLSKKSFSNKKKSPHPAQRHDSNSAFRCLISAYFLKEKRPTAWPTTWAFQKILLQTKQIVHQSAWDRLSQKNLFLTKKSPPGTAPQQQQRIPQVNCILFLKKKNWCMTRLSKKFFFKPKKNCASIQLSKKNLFITKRKVPTQPRIPQVNCCFFCKRKKPGPRLSKKLFFKQKK